MPRYAFIVFCLSASAAYADQRETRCGWLTNPTPANYDLEDAHGFWILSVQGRGEVPGFFDADEAAGGRGEWVQMSPAGYGYGCACILGRFGEIGSGVVYQVDRVRYLPLQQCATDPALPTRDLKPLWEGE